MKTPEEVYEEIREAHPDEPFGPHWEGVGYYCGDDVWCDPDEVGMEGEYEFWFDHQG